MPRVPVHRAICGLIFVSKNGLLTPRMLRGIGQARGG
jgi:hypothetical protein